MSFSMHLGCHWSSARGGLVSSTNQKHNAKRKQTNTIQTNAKAIQTAQYKAHHNTQYEKQAANSESPFPLSPNLFITRRVVVLSGPLEGVK
jgi:hypothetical protein